MVRSGDFRSGDESGLSFVILDSDDDRVMHLINYGNISFVRWVQQCSGLVASRNATSYFRPSSHDRNIHGVTACGRISDRGS